MNLLELLALYKSIELQRQWIRGVLDEELYKRWMKICYDE